MFPLSCEMGEGHFSRGATWRAFAVVLCFWGVISLSSAARLSAASRQKLEVQKHLKRLNKPAVTSIEVPLSHLSRDALPLLFFFYLFSFRCGL